MRNFRVFALSLYEPLLILLAYCSVTFTLFMGFTSSNYFKWIKLFWDYYSSISSWNVTKRSYSLFFWFFWLHLVKIAFTRALYTMIIRSPSLSFSQYSESNTYIPLFINVWGIWFSSLLSLSLLTLLLRLSPYQILNILFISIFYALLWTSRLFRSKILQETSNFIIYYW